MKKIFGLMVMSLVALLPLSAKATVAISKNCSTADADGVITCTLGYSITDEEGASSLTVTLTELGGAEIIDVMDANDSEWSVSNKNESNGVWTVILASPGVNGEGSLFTFTYKPSGMEGCGIEVALDDAKLTVTPDEPTPDTPTDNKQTGATLPYIALGCIAVLATGAYLATRNKSKMYKI